ncbi:MAG: MarR family transcriptional regulator [Proteobacteria bacterium]|nr:MarR family transcriptional regulator [Pseudomonadota bacterium]
MELDIYPDMGYAVIPVVKKTTHATLYALFELARADRPAQAGVIAEAIGSTPSVVARALVELEQEGLVDATRARLTMRGLAVAAALENDAKPPRLDIPEPRGARNASARRGRSSPPIPTAERRVRARAASSCSRPPGKMTPCE